MSQKGRRILTFDREIDRGLVFAMDLAGPKKPSEVAPGDVIGYVLANVDSALARQAQASAGRQQGAAKKEKQEESSSEDDEDYPPEPQRCLVSGPGFAVSGECMGVHGVVPCMLLYKPSSHFHSSFHNISHNTVLIVAPNMQLAGH